MSLDFQNETEGSELSFGDDHRFVLTAANTYCVDVMQHKSSEVIAVNNALRYTLSAAASAFVLPLIVSVFCLPLPSLSALILSGSRRTRKNRTTLE